jgi:hypothetical protein
MASCALTGKRRFSSEADYRAAIEREAELMWNERELQFPPMARQKWSEGTELARERMLEQARAEIDGSTQGGRKCTSS